MTTNTILAARKQRGIFHRPSDPATHLDLETRVPFWDPMALYVPERQLVSSVPLLSLYELIPGTISGRYERTEADTILDDRDRLIRHHLQQGRTQAAIEVHCDQIRGRPTVYDWDYLLATITLAQSGHAEEDGTLKDPSYRRVLYTLDRLVRSESVNAAAEAFERFGGCVVQAQETFDFTVPFTVHTSHTGIQYPRISAPAALGIEPVQTNHPNLRRRNKGQKVETKNQFVLEYQVEKTLIQGKPDQTRSHIGKLRINPYWLGHGSASAPTWIPMELVTGLRSGWAKRLLQDLINSIGKRWTPGERWEFVLSDTVVKYEAATNRTLRKHREACEAALNELASAGVLSYSVQPHAVRGSRARDNCIIVLDMGPVATSLAYQYGLRPSQSPTYRLLVSRLRAFGFGETEAHTFVQRATSQVQTVLRRVDWLQMVYQGRSAPGVANDPVENWFAWIRKAIEERYGFAEPEWLAFVNDRLHGIPFPAPVEAQASVASGTTETLETKGTIPSPEAVAQATQLQNEAKVAAALLGRPDSQWKRVLERLGTQYPPGFFWHFAEARSELVSAVGGVVVIAVEDPDLVTNSTITRSALAKCFAEELSMNAELVKISFARLPELAAVESQVE